MFSKTPVVLAAGLLSSVWAQNLTSNNTLYTNVTVNAGATVVVDVYAATTTVLSQCSVCTAGATPGSAYTVVVSNGVTTTLGSGPLSTQDAAAIAASAAAAAASSASAGAADAAQNTAVPSMGPSAGNSASATCGFALSVNGTTILQQISDGQIQAHQAPQGVGQIADGQVQAGAGLTTSFFTIANGMVYDQAGRICSISGQNQSQFQCNYVPTDGSTTNEFSIIGMNLAFNGNTQFYACFLGAAGEGYNIYYELTGNQNNCSPITLAAIGSTDCAPVTTTVPVESVVPVTTLQPSVATTTTYTPATTTTAAATAIFTNAGSVSRASTIGLAAAAAFALYMI